MSRRTKILGAVAATAAVTAIGAYALAQGGPGSGHGRMGMSQGGMGHGSMGGGPGGMMGGQLGNPAARLDAIRSEIGIRPEQTTAWDAYAKVVSEVSNDRRTHREKIDRDAIRQLEPAERQAHVDSMRGQRERDTARVRSAADTLLAQLDDAQQEKARRVLPGLTVAGNSGGMHGMMGGMGGGHGMGHGMGMGPRWNR